MVPIPTESQIKVLEALSEVARPVNVRDLKNLGSVGSAPGPMLTVLVSAGLVSEKVPTDYPHYDSRDNTFTLTKKGKRALRVIRILNRIIDS